MLGGGTHHARGDRAEALRRVLRAYDAERGIGPGAVVFGAPWDVHGGDGRGLDDTAARPEVGGGGGGDVLGDLEEAGSPVGGADVATSAAADGLGSRGSTRRDDARGVPPGRTCGMRRTSCPSDGTRPRGREGSLSRRRRRSKRGGCGRPVDARAAVVRSHGRRIPRLEARRGLGQASAVGSPEVACLDGDDLTGGRDGIVPLDGQQAKHGRAVPVEILAGRPRGGTSRPPEHVRADRLSGRAVAAAFADAGRPHS